MVTNTNMKLFENSKETHYLVFIGNIDCNMSATSAAAITTKGELCLKCKSHNFACGFTRRDQQKEFSDASERCMLMNRLKLTQSEAGIGSS
jgi:hypothetical protein